MVVVMVMGGITLVADLTRKSIDTRYHHVRAVVKTAFAHISANSPASTATSKYIDIKDIKSWSDELSGGLRPGRNIEDVEREAIDHLFNAQKQHNSSHQSDSAHWSPLSNIRKYLKGNKSAQVTADDVLRATTSVQNTDFASSSVSSQFAATASEMQDYSPVKFDDPNAPRQATAEEASKDYTDLNKYKPVTWNEPDGLPGLTPEEQSKKYQDLDKYASSDTSNDVTGVESSGPRYDDLQKYKPVEWNEPDGLREQTPEELSKNYDDLHKYGPATWNEPDGLPAPTPEELSKNYDDLDKYGPVQWNEPDGLQKLTPEELSKQYDDLSTYSKPFVAPDALLEAHEAAQQDATPRAEPIGAKVVDEDALAADPARDYNDLDKYGPVKWNEPDGLQKLTPEELSKNYQDLHLYSQFPNSGPTTPRIHPEEASKQYKDLRKYDAFPNAGPAEERIHPEVASKQYDDLHKYQSAGYEEPDKTTYVHPEELTKNYQDLDKYRTDAFDSFDKKYPVHPEEASKAYDDLGAYKPVMHTELDGKPVEVEPQTAAEIRRDVLQRASDIATDAQADKASSALGCDKEEADFSSMDESFPSEKADGALKLQPGLDRHFSGTSDTKSIPSASAMNRLEKTRLEDDPYSKSPQGLELSYMENDCAGKTGWPIFVRHYNHGRQDKGRRLGAISSGMESTSEDQPVLYKVLAYDPSTQSMSVAETCSRAHDTSTPATPAEVLLRVSNPSKFFPYFSALQAEGYEIASGSGDLLVFRKVQPGTAFKDASGSTINPIDMMGGRSGASNFASPTGYVNYESPQYRSVHAEPAQEVEAGKKKKKKRSLGRKVMIGTAWVAGTAYAVSVAAEFLSTGGGTF
ncbi:hypothetical protein E4U55_001489 [Claviceps digitariae]|nr:hypothetical protein E4U55_001489 [Claviceps digitariae]